MPTDATLPAAARPSAVPATAARVTTVLVSHDGAAWLPRTLAAIAAQTRQPDGVVAIDTGSTDEPRTLIADALGSEHILDAGPSTGFGAAVLLGLAHVAAHRQSAAQGLVTDVGGPAVGGTAAGSTDVGGTDVGGTDVGGTDVGGTDVGGTDVGGTASANAADGATAAGDIDYFAAGA